MYPNNCLAFFRLRKAVNESDTLTHSGLNERQKAKKQGVIAVQRKLLLLTYSLWKTGREYLENCA